MNHLSETGAYRKYLQKRRQQTIFFFMGMFFILCAVAIAGWVLLKGEAGAESEPSGISIGGTRLMDTRFLAHDVRLEPTVGSLTRTRLLPVAALSEDTELETAIRRVIGKYPSRFVPHLYFYDPADQSYVDIGGEEPVAAASVIKLPVLFAWLEDMDQGNLAPETELLYLEHHRAGGAGMLQFQPPGFSLTSQDVATRMIQLSDNTATNIMIDSLGGSEKLNRRFDALGMRETRINDWLPDLPGTNVISMRDMVTLLHNIESGTLLSSESREMALGILKGTHNRRLIPARLPEGTVVAHKTGDIGSALVNSGIVYLPDGRHYYISVQVDRPFNDYTARDIIQEISRTVYDHELAKEPPQIMTRSKAPDANG